MKQLKRFVSVCTVGAMALSLMAGAGSVPVFAAGGSQSAEDIGFDVEEFESPTKEYQPGVRWWWPGGAVEKDELKSEIEYLAENNFGYVEINPFDVTDDMGGLVEGTEEAYHSIFTPEFYELLDYAIGLCEENGITVDLNMGSGWNANSQYVTMDESMGNMALGRETVTAAELSGGIVIPKAEKSEFYVSRQGNWNEELVHLQGILIGEIADEEGTSLNRLNDFYGADGEVEKTYSSQIVLNVDNSYYISAEEAGVTEAGDTLNLDPEILSKLDGDKAYEVIAMYYVPSGAYGVDCANEWYTVDHMNAELCADYINDWLGDEYMTAILESHSNIRSVFNDSYEFYSDIYYNEGVAELAANPEISPLDYDFSKYLPTMYASCWAIPLWQRTVLGRGGEDTFLTYSTDSGVTDRITYDYNLLVNQLFMEGMEAFAVTSDEYGLLYRQEAYNPPIDTIGSAKYVQIPEVEGSEELVLKRGASGAHLYGRNLVTCEQYTLGNIPLGLTLEQLKIGYDLMATSGVNNYNYHGLNYLYGLDTEQYGEMGWTPWESIGINMSEKNSLSPYFGDLNMYSARVNYMMQIGSPSMDIAYYMEFNGDITEGTVVTTLDTYGYAYDAINDDSIQSEDTVVLPDGTISANGGNMIYDAIVIDETSLPVATMEKLVEMAEDGASIIFVGSAPTTQPGYMDGNYAAEDAKVAAMADEILAQPTGILVDDDVSSLASVLSTVSDPEVSYEANSGARFIRRTLDNGAELVYIRNVSADENEITIDVSSAYGDCYWFDQSSGKIYPAEKNGDIVTITMDASNETYGDDNAYSMAVALVCEPVGVSLDESLLSDGAPEAAVDDDDYTEIELVVDSLTVGDAVYTDQVLGKWNDEEFNGGALMASADTGVYHTVYTSNGTEEKVTLSLSNVYSAATIYVNGVEAGKMMYSPYELDITGYIVEGDNDIEIAVTPRKYNYVYQTPEYDTGMEGPVMVKVVGLKAGDESVDQSGESEGTVEIPGEGEGTVVIPGEDEGTVVIPGEGEDSGIQSGVVDEIDEQINDSDTSGTDDESAGSGGSGSSSSSSGSSTGSVKTADENTPFMFFAIAIIACAAVVVGASTRRRTVRK